MSHDEELAALGGRPAVPPELCFRATPEITAEDEAAVLASLRQPHHAWGPNVEALAADFGRWNGNVHCAPTNSGTAALHMAVAAVSAGAGDEIVTTALSWTSTATSILHHNAIPVFVDVDWETMLIDPARIEAAIGPKTRAILVVHYWGLPCDMDAIGDVARRHGLRIIEDACQAHGSTYRGRKTGTLGDVAAFSLNQNKMLCGGEGGLFVTDDASLYERGRSLMNFGQMGEPGRHTRSTHAYGMGWMYRTSDLPAALSRSQLARLDDTVAAAVRNVEAFVAALVDTPDVVLPSTREDRRSNGYACPLRVAPAAARRRGVPLARLRDAAVCALVAEGVPAVPARWMLPAHTVFQAQDGYGGGCPWTCHLAQRRASYDLAQFPVAQACVDSTIWIASRSAQPLRPPHGLDVIAQIAAATDKVFRNIDRVPLR